MSHVPLLLLDGCMAITMTNRRSQQKSLGGDCERAVLDAIDAGYRHIDTAYFYENEHEVGKAVQKKIAEGVIKREDIFIVSKVIISKH